MKPSRVESVSYRQKAHALARGCLGALALLALSGCASWFSPSAPKPEPLLPLTPSVGLEITWRVTLGGKAGETVLVPAAHEGAVFAAAVNGRVLRIESGRVVWETDLKQPIVAGVGTNGELVAVVTAQGQLVGLDAAQGQVRFSVPVKGEVLATPAVTGQTVVVATTDSRLLGFSTRDGQARWTQQRTSPPLVLRQFSSLLVDGEIVVAGYPGGRLGAVDARQGQALWTLALSHPRGATELERLTDVAGAPIVTSSSLLCAASYQGRIGCFDARNGRLRWSHPFSSTVGVDHDGERLFSVDAQNRVAAFGLDDGEPQWQVAGFAHRHLNRPLALNTWLVLGDVEGYVHVLDTHNGQGLARIRLDDSRVSAPALPIGTGRFVVQTQSGVIYALQIR